jgi:hypothetical protein
MICLLPVTVEPFQFSPAEPVAYELSHFEKLREESFQNPVCSVTCASGNSQHNSRTAERSAFKFPDEKTDCDES